MNRLRVLVSTIGLAAACLAVTAPSAAGARSAHPSATNQESTTAGLGQATAAAASCADQLSQDDGISNVSQNFEAQFDQYDSRAADDFRLTETCTIQEVDVIGTFFNGIGPAASVDIRFYVDDAGTPGARRAHRPHQDYTAAQFTGNLKVVLSSPVRLRAGTYWISVRANMDFDSAGEWGWNTRAPGNGAVAKWKNAGDGFNTGCRTYQDLPTCYPADQGPDLAFALLT